MTTGHQKLAGHDRTTLFQKLIISGIKSSINSSRQNIASAIKVISMQRKKALNEDEVDEDK